MNFVWIKPHRSPEDLCGLFFGQYRNKKTDYHLKIVVRIVSLLPKIRVFQDEPKCFAFAGEELYP
jgi:hypothetical protein